MNHKVVRAKIKFKTILKLDKRQYFLFLNFLSHDNAEIPKKIEKLKKISFCCAKVFKIV